MLSNLNLKLKWKRPASVPFPNTWQRFQAKDLNSDDLVEYRIEDLTEDRFEGAFQNMKENFAFDEPQIQSCNAANDEHFMVEFYELLKAICLNRMGLVCLKQGSNEIIGVNCNYVLTKDDDFEAQLQKNLNSHQSLCNVFDTIELLCKHGNLNVFDKYGVNKSLESLGISVARKYRGRKIGEKLYEARRYVGQAFDVALTHTYFSSDVSNRIADKVGFKLDVSLSFDEIRKLRPHLQFPNIASKGATLKTWVF